MNREKVTGVETNRETAIRKEAKPGLTLAFLALEIAWLASWLEVSEALLPVPPRLPLVLLSLVYPLARLIGPAVPAGWLPGGETRLNRKRFAIGWLLTLAAALALVVLFSPFGSWSALYLHWPGRKLGLVTLVAACFLLRRGLWLSGRVVDRRGLATALQLGLVMLVLVHLAVAAAQFKLPTLLPLTMLFVLAGLGGLVLARTEKPESGQAGGRGPGLNLPVVAFFILLIAALWLALDKRAVEILIQPFVWLWQLLSALLDWLASLISPDTDYQLPDLPDLPTPPDDRPLANRLKFLEKLKPVAEALFIFSVMALVFGALKSNIEDLLAWLRRRYSTSPGARLSRSRAGFFSDVKALLVLLAALFRALAARLKGRPKTGPPVSARAASIRQAYRRLLNWAAAREMTKIPAETPAEYAGRLRGWLIPGGGKRAERKYLLAHQAALELTGLYERARYSGFDLTREEVQRARRSLKMIKKGRFQPLDAKAEKTQATSGRLDKWQPLSLKKDEKSDQHD